MRRSLKTSVLAVSVSSTITTTPHSETVGISCGAENRQAASQTCSTVSSSCSAVFFSERLAHPRAKQMTQLSDIHMAVNRSPAANLELVHPEFVLGLAETVLDRKT